MKKEYQNWIESKNYHIPEESSQKCIEAVEEMVKVFPELEKRGGVVYSDDNIDNYLEYVKEYTHMWCIDKSGEVIDPTKSQYYLISNLQYKEHDLNKRHMKCMGCGCYFEGRNNYCGKCKWS